MLVIVGKLKAIKFVDDQRFFLIRNISGKSGYSS
jgi:hypothetical protein